MQTILSIAGVAGPIVLAVGTMFALTAVILRGLTQRERSS
jgi:hypothetical protein